MELLPLLLGQELSSVAHIAHGDARGHKSHQDWEPSWDGLAGHMVMFTRQVDSQGYIPSC